MKGVVQEKQTYNPLTLFIENILHIIKQSRTEIGNTEETNDDTETKTFVLSEELNRRIDIAVSNMLRNFISRESFFSEREPFEINYHHTSLKEIVSKEMEKIITSSEPLNQEKQEAIKHLFQEKINDTLNNTELRIKRLKSKRKPKRGALGLF